TYYIAGCIPAFIPDESLKVEGLPALVAGFFINMMQELSDEPMYCPGFMYHPPATARTNTLTI
ncbi:hypothetical protein ACR8NY_005494, partial [Klebsiella pneumoniae]